MPGADDRSYYEALDTALTEVIRLARHPRLAEKMSAGIDEDIDRRLLLMLNLIADRGPLRAAELVALMALDQSTVSRHLTALERHGFVGRATDPRDRRAALVAVTPRGSAAIMTARRAWQRTLAELLASWPATQRRALLRSLTELAGGLDEVVNADDDRSR